MYERIKPMSNPSIEAERAAATEDFKLRYPNATPEDLEEMINELSHP